MANAQARTARSAANAKHNPTLNTQRDKACADYGPRIVSGDDPEAARILSELSALDVERAAPFWQAGTVPDYPRGIGATRLTSAKWQGTAAPKYAKQATALKRAYTAACTADVIARGDALFGEPTAATGPLASPRNVACEGGTAAKMTIANGRLGEGFLDFLLLGPCNDIQDQRRATLSSAEAAGLPNILLNNRSQGDRPAWYPFDHNTSEQFPAMKQRSILLGAHAVTAPMVPPAPPQHSMMTKGAMKGAVADAKTLASAPASGDLGVKRQAIRGSPHERGRNRL